MIQKKLHNKYLETCRQIKYLQRIREFNLKDKYLIDKKINDLKTRKNKIRYAQEIL